MMGPHLESTVLELHGVLCTAGRRSHKLALNKKQAIHPSASFQLKKLGALATHVSSILFGTTTHYRVRFYPPFGV